MPLRHWERAVMYNSSAAQDDYDGADRRAATRHSCRIPTQCEARVPPRELSWRGEISDISASGLGLHLRRRFEPDTILAIQLPAPVGAVLARVVHVRPEARGWFMGCEMAECLSETTAQALAQRSWERAADSGGRAPTEADPGHPQTGPSGLKRRSWLFVIPKRAAGAVRGWISGASRK